MNLLKLCEIAEEIKNDPKCFNNIIQKASEQTRKIYEIRKIIIQGREEYKKGKDRKTEESHERITEIFNQIAGLTYAEKITDNQEKYQFKDVNNELNKFENRADFLTFFEFLFFSDFDLVSKFNSYINVISGLIAENSKNYHYSNILLNTRFISIFFLLTNPTLYPFYSCKNSEFLASKLGFQLEKYIKGQKIKDDFLEYVKYVEAIDCVTNYLNIIIPEVYLEYKKQILEFSSDDKYLNENRYILTNEIIYSYFKQYSFHKKTKNTTTALFKKILEESSKFYQEGDIKNLDQKIKYFDYTNLQLIKKNILDLAAIKQITEQSLFTIEQPVDIGIFGEKLSFKIIFFDYLKNCLATNKLHDFPLIIKLSDLRRQDDLKQYFLASNFYGCDYVVLNSDRSLLRLIEVKTTRSIDEITNFKLTGSELACCEENNKYYFVYLLAPDSCNPSVINKYELNYDSLCKFKLVKTKPM